jgi:hypothetical protein
VQRQLSACGWQRMRTAAQMHAPAQAARSWVTAAKLAGTPARYKLQTTKRRDKCTSSRAGGSRRRRGGGARCIHPEVRVWRKRTKCTKCTREHHQRTSSSPRSARCCSSPCLMWWRRDQTARACCPAASLQVHRRAHWNALEAFDRGKINCCCFQHVRMASSDLSAGDVNDSDAPQPVRHTRSICTAAECVKRPPALHLCRSAANSAPLGSPPGHLCTRALGTAQQAGWRASRRRCSA